MNFLPLLAAAGDVNYWPLVVLAVAVACVIVGISRLKLHPFLALILAAIVAGLLADQLPDARPRNPPAGWEPPPGVKLVSHWQQAVELTMKGLGQTAGGIAASIALASIIGMCLMESGGADRVVRRFLALLGEKGAAVALLVATYILGVPLFFDTLFMLMVPLARALWLRTGRDYLFYILCVCTSGVIMHSMTSPHPGPLAMVEYLNLNLGLSIAMGFLVGIPPAIGGYFVSRWINRRMEIPVRDVPGVTMDELHAIVRKPESELPGFGASLVPVLLPIFLITFAAFLEVVRTSATGAGGWADTLVGAFGGAEGFRRGYEFFAFIGNKNIALLIGTAAALWLVARQKRLAFTELGKLVGPPLETAGIIILITAAGGAFGLMLRSAGVGESIKQLAMGHAINLILLSWLVALVLRVAQGSATVAMLTTAAMVQGMVDPATAAALPYHPIYLYLGIGFGSFGASWMNDSGFWVVSRLGGLTEKETLKSWTVLLTCNSVVGLATTWILSLVLPLK